MLDLVPAKAIDIVYVELNKGNGFIFSPHLGGLSDPFSPVLYLLLPQQ